MSSAAVVFQCAACRALGVAHEVTVGADGASVGLACTSCATTTWLPVAAAGNVRAGARPPTHAALALPAAVATTLAPTTTTAVTATAATTPDDGEDADSGRGVLAPPVSMSSLPAPAIEESPAPSSAPQAETAADAPAAPTTAVATAFTPATTTTATTTTATKAATTTRASAIDDDARTRILARWSALGDVNAAQAPLATRLERLLRGAWSDDAEHKAVLKAASVADELGFVGGRYRAVLDVVRDEPHARAAQQELLTLAMLTMKGTRDFDGAGDGRGKSKVYIAALAVALIGFVGALGYFLFQLFESFQRLGEIG
jgi:hypothetical protein